MRNLSFALPSGLQIALVSGCALLLTQSLRAQDALRTAVQGDEAYRLRSSTNYVPPQYRLHAGPVEFQASVGYGLEWNDNIFVRPTGKESDWIHRPQFNLLGSWQSTETSRINFGVGVSYQVYMNHPELNGLIITPNTDLTWDIRAKDFVFTFYDSFSYLQDVLTVPTIGSGNAQFPRIENTIGARVRWYPSRYVFELGYGHYNFLPVSSASPEFDYLTRNAEQFFGRAGIRLAEVTSVGMEGSTSFTDYKLPIQSDNVNVSFGPYLDWQVTEVWHASLRGGWVYYSYDPSESMPDGANLHSYYVSFITDHQLTGYIRHGISVVRDVQQGFNQGSDYIEELVTRYFVDWNFHRSATLSANVSYQFNREPQGGVATTYNVYGAGLGLTVRPTTHVDLGLNYSFTTRDSSVPNNNYTQNSVFLNILYRF
jgi:hypothetical protein